MQVEYYPNLQFFYIPVLLVFIYTLENWTMANYSVFNKEYILRANTQSLLKKNIKEDARFCKKKSCQTLYRQTNTHTHPQTTIVYQFVLCFLCRWRPATTLTYLTWSYQVHTNKIKPVLWPDKTIPVFAFRRATFQPT